MNQKYREQNLQAITEYFASGCKADGVIRYGLEVEHFAVKKEDHTSVTYEGADGMEVLLHELYAAVGGEAVYYGTHQLGIDCPDYNITIEPASQLEISTRSCDTIAELAAIYREFRAAIDPIMEAHGLTLMAYGYQPKSCVEDLPLIPKKRYTFMDAYFRTHGTRGINMMRGTASTQISIDYFDEADFVRKMRLASLLSPVIKLLTDNTPYFEGKPADRPLLRSWIWEDVDTARTGLIPGLTSDDFGFRAYAEYLWDIPLILKMENGEAVCTDDLTVGEVYGDAPVTKEDIDHIISMVFPDVRLKKFVEIRMADSMDEANVLAYAAFIKGLFGSSETVKELTDRFSVNEEQIRKAEVSLMRYAYDGEIYGMPADKFACAMTDLACKNLPENERSYLQPFYARICSRRTLTQEVLDAAEGGLS